MYLLLLFSFCIDFFPFFTYMLSKPSKGVLAKAKTKPSGDQSAAPMKKPKLGHLKLVEDKRDRSSAPQLDLSQQPNLVVTVLGLMLHWY